MPGQGSKIGLKLLVLSWLYADERWPFMPLTSPNMPDIRTLSLRGGGDCHLGRGMETFQQ